MQDDIKNILTQRKSSLGQRYVPPPKTMNDPGTNGDIAEDEQYLYIYSNGWKRIAISLFL